MIPIHYAVQTSTTKSNQGRPRFCSDSKSEITKKCVTSLFQSIRNCTAEKEAIHHVRIIDDNSDPDTVEYLKMLCKTYESELFKPEFTVLNNSGIMNSIRECYTHLAYNCDNIGYQVQDDYLFEPNAVLELVDIFYQVFEDTNTQPFVSGYHPPYWYYFDEPKKRYPIEPICMFQGKHRYWRQGFNTSCSFLTSTSNFQKHWDIIELFLRMSPLDETLEAKSLNKIFTTRGELFVVPVNSFTFHMQGEAEKDPYTDWKPLWESIDIK